VWATQLATATIRVVTSPFGNVIINGTPDAGVAMCNADEVVVGGGGQCQNGLVAWLHQSNPAGNGWVANCYGSNGDNPARAYAVCLSKR